MPGRMADAVGADGLDAMLDQTRQLVTALQALQVREAEATRRAESEAEAHATTRKRAEEAEADCESAKKSHEDATRAHAEECAAHEATKAQVESLRAAAMIAEEDVKRMREEMDRLRAESEGLRKDLSTQQARAAETYKDYATLHQSHIQAKSALEAALQAQEAYRKEYYSTREALERVRSESARQAEEIQSLHAERVPLEEACARQTEYQALLAEREKSLASLRDELDLTRGCVAEAEQQKDGMRRELAETKEVLTDREMQLADARRELEGVRNKQSAINSEFSKVQDVLRSVMSPPGAGA